MPGLLLQVAPSDAEGGIGIAAEGRRVGFTASKRVGGAVVRNRAKRRLRAASRQVMTEHAAPDSDYVLVAREDTPSRPYRMLLTDLETGLKRLKVWRDSSSGDE